MGGSTARPLTEHVRSHRFNLWHHIYRTWWHSLTCNPSTWEIEKDQKFKAIYRTHQVGDKAGHKRHRLIKNKTTTNTGHYCRDLERIIWKIKTIHVSVRVYMYALATVPMGRLQRVWELKPRCAFLPVLEWVNVSLRVCVCENECHVHDASKGQKEHGIPWSSSQCRWKSPD